MRRPSTRIAWSHAWNRQMADLRAAVRAAGGTERDALAIAAAAVRRAAQFDHFGPCGPALVQHASIRLRHGVAITTVLEDLER